TSARRSRRATSARSSRSSSNRLKSKGVRRDDSGVTTTAAAQDTHQAPGSTGGGSWRMLYRAGLLRAAWMFVMFGGLGFGLVVLVRWAAHWHPIIATEPLVLVAGLVTAPIGFLAGI